MEHNIKEKAQLREAGLRVTEARLEVLRALSAQGKPLSAQTLWEGLDKRYDQATVYRTLSSMVTAGLVKEVLLQSGVSHYEVADLGHHHHIVCQDCGRVEDVEACAVQLSSKETSFASVDGHRLEFYGLCTKCAA